MSKKYAIVTGASSGIGLELARIMAVEKINLVLVARNLNSLAALKDEIQTAYQIDVHCLAIDLSKLNASQEVYDYCAQNALQIEYLVNNAGFGDFGFFAESEWSKQNKMIQLNITALTQMTHLFLPGMVKQGSGRIMQVASVASFLPGPLMSVYYATKAYVLHFSEAISNELEGTGVTVTALCPGPTTSGFQDAAGMGESKLVKDRKLPSSAEVARYGFKAMMQGKRLAIHGFKNYLMANSVRFSPRGMVLKVARKIQDKK
ncbi:MAG: SDR family NAD(P)-dependent oxidoreductase [Flavobacteriales bacterium]